MDGFKVYSINYSPVTEIDDSATEDKSNKLHNAFILRSKLSSHSQMSQAYKSLVYM